MDEFKFRRGRVPAFGNWDYNNDMEFTQCFESPMEEPRHVQYSSSKDRDLYPYDVVTAAMIVVPRQRGFTKEKKGDKWCDCDWKATPSPVSVASLYSPHIHAVDQDLYTPDVTPASAKRKRARSFFSSCLRPDCLS